MKQCYVFWPRVGGGSLETIIEAKSRMQAGEMVAEILYIAGAAEMEFSDPPASETHHDKGTFFVDYIVQESGAVRKVKIVPIPY